MTATLAVSSQAAGPRISTVRSGSLLVPALRLDAKHYQEEFTLARARVAGCGFPSKAVQTIARAFLPQRLTRIVTVPQETAGPPYLRAHDAFETLPESERFISKAMIPNHEAYFLQEGMLLTPSSGRNLGPLAFVGKKLSRFAMTDILRIVPHDRETGYYLLAYLMTHTGQALIRRGRTGTTVDHLSHHDVHTIPVVWPDKGIRERFAKIIGEAETLLDDARLILDELEAELHRRASLTIPPPRGIYLPMGSARAFNYPANALTLRLDAEFYDPTVRMYRESLRKTGAVPLRQMAELRLLGRYKRYYVEKGHGRPILSGRQLLQLRPVNLRYISDRSFRDPEAFLLRKGWTIFTCDGRAEEALGSPAFVSSLWEGWMASNHVMRALPLEHIQPGYLYLALRSPYVQAQLKARATGSVVDALDPATIGDVLLPQLSGDDRRELGVRAEGAWEKIAVAIRMEEEAVTQLEGLIVDGYESGCR